VIVKTARGARPTPLSLSREDMTGLPVIKQAVVIVFSLGFRFHGPGKILSRHFLAFLYNF
jgi:hypothetical protein